jgi:hypothetical protein
MTSHQAVYWLAETLKTFLYLRKVLERKAWRKKFIDAGET